MKLNIASEYQYYNTLTMVGGVYVVLTTSWIGVVIGRHDIYTIPWIIQLSPIVNEILTTVSSRPRYWGPKTVRFR